MIFFDKILVNAAHTIVIVSWWISVVVMLYWFIKLLIEHSSMTNIILIRGFRDKL